MAHSIEFKRSGRGKAQCKADAAFPDGIVADLRMAGQAGCTVDLPYPAPECGVWIVRCSECDYSVAITAAGRPDDPKRLTLPCDVRELARRKAARN